MRSRKLSRLRRRIPMALACLCSAVVAHQQWENTVRDDSPSSRATRDVPGRIWDSAGLRIISETDDFRSQLESTDVGSPSGPTEDRPSRNRPYAYGPIDHLEYRATIDIRRRDFEERSQSSRSTRFEPRTEPGTTEWESVDPPPLQWEHEDDDVVKRYGLEPPAGSETTRRRLTNRQQDRPRLFQRKR